MTLTGEELDAWKLAYEDEIALIWDQAEKATRAKVAQETKEKHEKIIEGFRQLEHLRRCEAGGPWNLPEDRDIMPIFTVWLQDRSGVPATIYLALPQVRQMVERLCPDREWGDLTITSDGPSNTGLVNGVVVMKDLMFHQLTPEAEQIVRDMYDLPAR